MFVHFNGPKRFMSAYEKSKVVRIFSKCTQKLPSVHFFKKKGKKEDISAKERRARRYCPLVSTLLYLFSLTSPPSSNSPADRCDAENGGKQRGADRKKEGVVRLRAVRVTLCRKKEPLALRFLNGACCTTAVSVCLSINVSFRAKKRQTRGQRRRGLTF